MIYSILTKICSFIFAACLAVAPVAQIAPTFGAVNPVGGQQYTLSGAGITSTQSTVQLTSFQTPDGRSLTMSMFGTIGYGALDPQTTSKIEDITFSGIVQNSNGTATLTGVTRGNDFITPYAASSTLAHSHSGGATFILTNTPGFYTQFASVNNAQTITGTWTYASTSPPQYDAGYSASGNQFVSYAQLNNVVIAGAGTSTESALGLVRLANSGQVGLGTASSSSGAPLVLENKFATTTPGTQCTSGVWNCIVATVNGAISASGSYFNSLLAATNSWSGANTFTATTTLTGSNINSNALKINSLSYAFPSSQGIASSTTLENDGLGNLTWLQAGRLLDASTTPNEIGSAATSTMYRYLLPANTLGANGIVHIRMGVTPNNANTDVANIEVTFGGSATTTIPQTQSTGGAVATVGYFDLYIMGKGTTNSQRMIVELTAYGNGNGIGTSPKYNDFVSATTLSVDTTQAQTIQISGRSAGGSSTWQPQFLTNELLKQ